MSNPIDVAVGERIRQLRKERRITQTELANAIGLTFQQIQKYEKARNRISASKLVQIAEIFEVDVAELFSPAHPELSEEEARENELALLLDCVHGMDADIRQHFMGLVGAIADNNMQR